MLSMRAHARVGLLGNPSDLVGGYGIGFAVRELFATATLTARDRFEASAALPNDLASAAWTVLGLEGIRRPFVMGLSNHIPFQSGLSGSSAIIVAALRAWSTWFGLGLSRSRIAELAWKAENEVLGIRAGPLDRVVQSHEGLLAVDCSRPFEEGAVERLDPARLPPLLLAWHGSPGGHSGDIHAPVVERHRAGDATVRRVMDGLAGNAREGRAALLAGDAEAFLVCVNRNFDLRASIYEIAQGDRALVDLGRSLGAATKFPGSGGAVLFACRDEADRARIEEACTARGHTTLVPSVALPTPRVRVVFLAAGFGTRLKDAGIQTAKPLLRVGGEPLLTQLLRQVERGQCVADGVVVTNGRYHEEFLAWERATHSSIPLAILNDGAVTDAERLGAIGDLDLALRGTALPTRDDIDAYLVLACDNLFTLDVAGLARSFSERGRGQLLLRQVQPPIPPSKYSEVTLAPDGRTVTSFREKPQDPRSDLSAVGAYLLPANLPGLVRDYLASGGNPDAPGHLIAWLSARMPLEATRITGSWLDIGTPEDLRRARQEA